MLLIRRGLSMASWLSSDMPKVNESSEIILVVVTLVRQSSDVLSATQKLNSLSQVLGPTTSQGRLIQSSLEGLT